MFGLSFTILEQYLDITGLTTKLKSNINTSFSTTANKYLDYPLPPEVYPLRDAMHQVWLDIMLEGSKVLYTIFSGYQDQDNKRVTTLERMHMFFTLNFITNGVASVSISRRGWLS